MDGESSTTTAGARDSSDVVHGANGEYDFYARGALDLNLADDNGGTETNAFSSFSPSFVLSRALHLASKFGAREDGALLQFCNT
jgi:hypothetical protein